MKLNELAKLLTALTQDGHGDAEVMINDRQCLLDIERTVFTRPVCLGRGLVLEIVVSDEVPLDESAIPVPGDAP